MIPIEYFVQLVPWMFGLSLAFLFYMNWRRERSIDREIARDERERQFAQAEEAARRSEHERDMARWRETEREKKLEEEVISSKAGGGAGGYIVLDLPNNMRGMFQDLLKGFEEYARLKGYSVSFSVDSTFSDRIAFKFTLTDPDVVVSNERIRKDLKDYLEKVTNGHSLQDLPQVISIEEHELLVATLTNRINFLQTNYNLAKVSADFYEGLIRRAASQPFLPSNIVVQTGGAYHAPNYTALNSPQALLGNGNSAESTIHIGDTYKERSVQIEQLGRLLMELRNEVSSDARDAVVRDILNAKEELESAAQPDTGQLAKWLKRAKETIQASSFGIEAVRSAQELFRLFGIL
jgi:hypothetical protein